MIERMYAEYAWEKTQTLLSIDSPSGYTAKAAQWVQDAFQQKEAEVPIQRVYVGGRDGQLEEWMP